MNGAAVVGDRAVPAPGSGGEIVLEGLAQCGHGAAAGAGASRVLAQGDTAEDFPGAAARLVGGDRAVAPDDDPPVGGRAAAVAGAVVDEVGRPRFAPWTAAPNAGSARCIVQSPR